MASDPFSFSQRNRLARAGYACVDKAWLPAASAERVQQEAETHRAEVERVAKDAPPPGRPKKAKS